MKQVLQLIFLMNILVAQQFIYSSEEVGCLTNIQQLTFPSMGFGKAGEAYFSPDGTKIIFQAVPIGQKHYQIYVMELDARTPQERIPRMVSTGYGACTCANFRPDGKKIIFASSHEDPSLFNPEFTSIAPGYKREGSDYAWDFTPYMNIYEANPDGTELKALTTGPSYHAECAYSPDGSRIVFASNVDGSMNLYTMANDGSDLYQVTKTTGIYNGGCFFSPDGSKIIYRADHLRQHYLQVYTINIDGTELRQLTDNNAVNWAPYWHPNGEVIAYTTSLHGHTQYEIYLLNIKTAASYRLTYNPTFDGLAVFNNEGNKLMWTSKRGRDGTCQIFLSNFVLPKEFTTSEVL